jgi:aspartokinase/homoserine dehydrogenase 1
MTGPRTTNIIQLGYGKVGGPLVRLAVENRETIERETGVLLHYAAIVRSSSIALGDEPALQAADRGPLFDGWTPRPQGLGLSALDPVFERYGNPGTTRYVLVDVTAAEQTAPLLLDTLAMGIPVVTANKIPLAETAGWFERAQEASRLRHVPFRYECTVGGSLPVISTLLDLLRTGDTVRSITALSSSSLSCIMGDFNKGMPLDDAISDAMHRGFAEPNPLTDLAGRDALRKTVILAKTMGLSTGIGDVRQEPLLDSEYPDLDTFREKGESRLAARLTAARQPGMVVYYVGTVTAEGSVTLGLRSFPQASIWGTLEPSENLFLFATERFGGLPVTVRGIGGGPVLTASGVLADTIKAAQTAVL